MNGEPFVFPRIWKWLDYMEKEGVKVSLYTNAEFLDVERIIKYKNIEYISCSINASTKETYDKVVRGPDFDKVIKNTKELIAKAPFFVRASFVRCDENIHEEEAFREMFRGKGKICGFANWTGDRKADIQRTGEKAQCNVLMTQMFVLWNGDVVPCCMDYDGKQILGNVKNNTLKEIRDNSAWLRYKHKQGDFDTYVCRNCNYNVINQK
jgi:radical SAM protein with 4Fe4S-binding SPASM domain